MIRTKLAVRFAYVVLVLASGKSLAQAGSVKLNSTLPAGGQISDNALFFSPDSSRVLYVGEQITDNVREVFTVPSGGGTPVKLNGPLAAGGQVFPHTPKFSSDSSRVLYIADQVFVNEAEVFSVPATGGTAVKLNPALAGNEVTNAAFLPNGSRVIYSTDQSSDDLNELYSVPSTGGASVKLNGVMQFNGDVDSGFKISSDSNRVVYRADQATDEVFEIYTVPSAGGTAVKLNSALVTGGDIEEYFISPDGSRVVYRADQVVDEQTELYSVPIAGGSPVKLNGTLVSGGDVFNSSWQISPDSTRVVYGADQVTDNISEIFSVPITGGTPTKLNGTLVAGRNSFLDEISPDGLRVLYIADQDSNDVNELYSVSIFGGPVTKLNSSLVAGGDVFQGIFSPDSQTVLYRATQEASNLSEIYSVPATGGSPVKLNAPVPASSFVEIGGLQFSPDSSRVLYFVQSNISSENNALFIVPASGGTPVKVHGTEVPNAGTGSGVRNGIKFSPDGSRVLYYTNSGDIYSRVVLQSSQGLGGNWDSGSTWNQGAAPDEVQQISIQPGDVITASGNSTPRSANELVIVGGSNTATLQLEDNASINVVNGLKLYQGGVIQGDGHISAPMLDVSYGDLRAGPGERLRFSAGNFGFTNSGRIEAIGTAANPAEFEYRFGYLTNAPGGLVTGHDATFRLASSTANFFNQGALALTRGTSDVFGDIDNQGAIVVSGGGLATFYDDVSQGGTLTVSKVGSSTSVAVFFGSLSGAGATGGGDVFIHGDLRPGFSPAEVTYENNVYFGGTSTLQIELGGLDAGDEFDKLIVDGQLELGGILDVDLIDLGSGIFSPQAGNMFEIISSTEVIDGEFEDFDLPELEGLNWDVIQDDYSVTLAVVAAADLVGDYNGDGKVSAADFTVWRDNLGASTLLNRDPNNSGTVNNDDFNSWKTHYGEGDFGSGTGAAASLSNGAPVPEPSSLVLACYVLMMAVQQMRPTMSGR